MNFSSGGHVQKMHFPNVEIRFYSTIQATASQPGILVLGISVRPVEKLCYQFCTRATLEY